MWLLGMCSRCISKPVALRRRTFAAPSLHYAAKSSELEWLWEFRGFCKGDGLVTEVVVEVLRVLESVVISTARLLEAEALQWRLHPACRGFRLAYLEWHVAPAVTISSFMPALVYTGARPAAVP